MGYRIDYGSGQAKRQKLRVIPRKTAAKVSVIVAAVLLLVVLFNFCGGQIVDFLLPGDPAVTEAALQDMVTDLGEGEGFRDAFAAFCQKIVDGAALYE